MKAIVIEQAGGPDVLQVRTMPTPEPRDGWVLIRVKAFGLNRSEMFTRQGHSPDVEFPRVLGIECVGVVEAAPGTDLQPGQTVAAVMGGMGRAFDGGYAEYALIPARSVLPVKTELPWEILGAIPETFLTAWGGLKEAMDMLPGKVLLVRGGTSSVGMAAISLAKGWDTTVIATTRNQAKVAALQQAGVNHVIIEQGQIASEVKKIFPLGVNYVLELVGTTLYDSLQATAAQGIVCYAGILGNAWTFENFGPMAAIPSTVKLTTYGSGSVHVDHSTAALQDIVDGVAAGRYQVNIDRVFHFDEIVDAHRHMEENRAIGKIVVLVD
ncbi:MAG TPA: zinc-binding alcohol dehydrogenase family protein [Dictyobacter sp.]|jgi:NADPH:quinone reductase-like Zn-dependent oxidoreductase|nr:zinc-binding alcohol dehydrogenase family protein [Dictyobacter sp.]